VASLGPPAAVAPEPPVSAGGGGEEVVREFKCRSCHVIDEDPAGGSTGPALRRAGFRELYTKEYFRRKVSDPVAFWPDTSMIYTPRTKKPTPQQVEALVEWFFGEG
ncbi:MAG: c-type cytochrome, partial [Planctomycetota bacterium]